MDFEWDEAKSERNRVRRGLPFDMAMGLFDGDVIEEADTRQDYGEVRIRAIGMVRDLLLSCIYTVRGDKRRIISLRVANRRERREYRSTKPG